MWFTAYMSLYVRPNKHSPGCLLLETPDHQMSLCPSLSLLTCFPTTSSRSVPCFSLHALHPRSSTTWLCSSYVHTCALWCPISSQNMSYIPAGYSALSVLDFASVNYDPLSVSCLCLLLFPAWPCQPVCLYSHTPACQHVSTFRFWHCLESPTQSATSNASLNLNIHSYMPNPSPYPMFVPKNCDVCSCYGSGWYHKVSGLSNAQNTSCTH